MWDEGRSCSDNGEKSCFSRLTNVWVCSVGLILALFLERMCFVVTVYKTQFYGYVCILVVVFLKVAFDGLSVVLKKKKHK